MKVTIIATLFALTLGTAFGKPIMSHPQTTSIPGYTHGSHNLPKAPLSLDELNKLRKALLLTEEDVQALRASKEILAPQVDAILDVWYGFVGGNDFLAFFFSKPDGKDLVPEYLAAVKKRFGQWILDTTDAKFDQAWLDYQFEIGRRHHKSGKNKTDGVSSVPQVNLRYLSALTIPITTTLKPFLAKTGLPAAEVEKMHAAWVKTVLLQTILWSYPYTKDGEF